MKELSVEEQIYLCKYHDVDKDLKFTTGLNENEVKETIYKLKQNGLYDQYRKLSEDEYENIIKKEKRFMLKNYLRWCSMKLYRLRV